MGLLVLGFGPIALNTHPLVESLNTLSIDYIALLFQYLCHFTATKEKGKFIYSVVSDSPYLFWLADSRKPSGKALEAHTVC
jgi:hypothetical protein